MLSRKIPFELRRSAFFLYLCVFLNFCSCLFFFHFGQRGSAEGERKEREEGEKEQNEIKDFFSSSLVCRKFCCFFSFFFWRERKERRKKIAPCVSLDDRAECARLVFFSLSHFFFFLLDKLVFRLKKSWRVLSLRFRASTALALARSLSRPSSRRPSARMSSCRSVFSLLDQRENVNKEATAAAAAAAAKKEIEAPLAFSRPTRGLFLSFFLQTLCSGRVMRFLRSVSVDDTDRRKHGKRERQGDVRKNARRLIAARRRQRGDHTIKRDSSLPSISSAESAPRSLEELTENTDV